MQHSDAQENTHIAKKLMKTKWDAMYTYHIDADTFLLVKLDEEEKIYPLRILHFQPSGKLGIKVHKGAQFEPRSWNGHLAIDNDSSSYKLSGDTLQLVIKGEYIGEEHFYFKRDYLLKIKNDREIECILIKHYFGDTCWLKKMAADLKNYEPVKKPTLTFKKIIDMLKLAFLTLGTWPIISLNCIDQR